MSDTSPCLFQDDPIVPLFPSDGPSRMWGGRLEKVGLGSISRWILQDRGRGQESEKKRRVFMAGILIT